MATGIFDFRLASDSSKASSFCSIRTLVISIIVFCAIYVGANLLRMLASGEQAVDDWPLAILPEPVRRSIAGFLIRTRRPRQSDAPRAKAA